MSEKLDMIIKNVNVIDGTGSPAFQSNVGIQENKIVSIDRVVEGPEAPKTIEGDGFYLAPGFIDSHAHYDIAVLTDDRINYCKLSQGITTEISGNCGISLAPVSEKYYRLWRTFLEKSTGSTVPDYLSEFKSYDRYFNKLDELGFAINMAYLVGQSAIRTAVLGFENRKATNREIEIMKSFVGDAMENGALGLSTGLFCSPGIFTPFEELIELCKVVKNYEGIYTSHIRSGYVLDAIKEAIAIGRQTGIPVHISHIKVSGKSNWGLSSEIVKIIEEANNEGLDVTADLYPYTTASSLLNFIIPSHYMQNGTEKMVELLKNKEKRKEIAEEMLHPKNGKNTLILECGYEGILIMVAPKTPEAVGKTIKQYAREKNIEPIDAIFDILVENQGAGVAAWFTMCEKDMQIFLKSPYVMFCTDGVPVPTGSGTHPRIMGSYPRILGKYVREKGIIKLEEAVRKMTSMPAQRFGFKNKGLIKEGFDADLVLFQPEKIIDCADFINCYANNLGIKYVIVNGQIVIDDNKFMDNYPGKLIRADRK
jgi:N-acyl-D-amino-acid deacylase